jgi:hypothetical protein
MLTRRVMLVSLALLMPSAALARKRHAKKPGAVTPLAEPEPASVRPVLIVPVPDKLVPTFNDVWRYRISGGE